MNKDSERQPVMFNGFDTEITSYQTKTMPVGMNPDGNKIGIVEGDSRLSVGGVVIVSG